MELRLTCIKSIVLRRLSAPHHTAWPWSEGLSYSWGPLLQYIDALRFGDIGKFQAIEKKAEGWYFPTLDRGQGATLHFACDHGQVGPAARWHGTCVLAFCFLSMLCLCYPSPTSWEVARANQLPVLAQASLSCIRLPSPLCPALCCSSRWPSS